LVLAVKWVKGKQLRQKTGVCGYWYGLMAIASLLLCLLIQSPAISQSTDAISQPRLSAVDSRDLVQQGKALYAAGRLIEAADRLQQAVQDYRRQGDTLRQAMTLSNLALVYQKAGLLADATQAIDHSLELLESSPSQLDQQPNARSQIWAQTLEIQGSLQLEQGQPQPALATWQKSEALYREMDDSSGVVRSQINQAQALQLLGFYRRALTLLTEISQRLQTQPDSLTKIVDLRSLGEALQFTGDLEQSRQVLQMSLDLSERLQLPEAISAALLSLGNTARVQQDIQSASHFYQQAAEVAPSPFVKVQAWINQFSLLVDTDQVPDHQLLSDITTELADLPIRQTTVYATIHFAQALIKLELIKVGHQVYLQAAPAAIAQRLSEATQQARNLGDQRAESYALGTLASLYEQAQQCA
jgi:tetratricopeptide (TPR) repeat protein